ncbi:MAG TPA: deoxyribodipyrimidine photo-lyase, partial [Polyangia bacterium]|nr:deoxyribodipyrimidine photo-lyase [Polyangia bacterium]
RPVVVFLGLVPFYPRANWRHYQFLVEGLPVLAERLARRGVGFVLRRYPDHRLLPLVAEVRPCLLVGDENPLRETETWREHVAAQLAVPFFTVDADVVVPTALISREQFAARTLRPRIHRLLPTYLVPGKEPVARRRWPPAPALPGLDPRGDLLAGWGPEGTRFDRSVAPVAGFRGGAAEGEALLERFIRERLDGYHHRRNRPELPGTSQLSPYLHFGQLGPRQVALAVGGAEAPAADREAFLEELIVRRELAVNYVVHNPNYDRLAGCEAWARRSLAEHARDPRLALLSEERLEAGESPDPLWNAAQRQMVETGWMHGYLRMYWAKRLLEWTASPEEAFDLAVRMNDRYELDGRDPNGYAGIAWAIGGKHDRAWGPERPIFGKVRYMSYASTSRKFDAASYIEAHAPRAPS